MLRNVVFLFLLAPTVFSTSFSKCTIGPAPAAVRLQGCDVNCKFSPGDVMLTQVDIKSNKNVTSLKADMYAAETYHLLEDSDGCSHLVNSKCPIEQSATATYTFNTTVQAQPLGKLPIHFTLTDQTVDTVACYDMEITVVAKST